VERSGTHGFGGISNACHVVAPHCFAANAAYFEFASLPGVALRSTPGYSHIATNVAINNDLRNNAFAQWIGANV
jgi:hypothetical protein